MKMVYCPVCAKETGHQRKLGFGTFFAVIITGGFWLLALPFYPQRCTICASAASGQPAAPPPLLDQHLFEQQLLYLDGSKKCPQCAETIKIEARKCRYCGETFDPGQVDREIAAQRAQFEAMTAAGRSLCRRCGHWDVVQGAVLPDGGLGPWCPHCRNRAG